VFSLEKKFARNNLFKSTLFECLTKKNVATEWCK
jgi:hypothetical protein